MEVRFVRETGANDPAIGYNVMPRDWHGRSSWHVSADPTRVDCWNIDTTRI